jgi:hypothetical protein
VRPMPFTDRPPRPDRRCSPRGFDVVGYHQPRRNDAATGRAAGRAMPCDRPDRHAPFERAAPMAVAILHPLSSRHNLAKSDLVSRAPSGGRRSLRARDKRYSGTHLDSRVVAHRDVFPGEKLKTRLTRLTGSLGGLATTSALGCGSARDELATEEKRARRHSAPATSRRRSPPADSVNPSTIPPASEPPLSRQRHGVNQ